MVSNINKTKKYCPFTNTVNLTSQEVIEKHYMNPLNIISYSLLFLYLIEISSEDNLIKLNHLYFNT